MNEVTKHKEWYRKGQGTENVGPFLQSLMALCRPQRVLELGAGYTTPFLIEGLENNKDIFIDPECINPQYLSEVNYDPKMVIIDNMIAKEVIKRVKDYDYVDVIFDNFQGKSQQLYEKYGKFDFVWMDCGGVSEYVSFMKEYWNICSDYVIFHYTYKGHSPTDLLGYIQLYAKEYDFHMDIVEPHKIHQSGLTILRKARLRKPTLWDRLTKTIHINPAMR